MASGLNAIPVPAFNDNYIWLIELTGRAHGQRAEAGDCGSPLPVAVVDPGTARPVIEATEQRHLVPQAVLVTHHHHDHVGGIRQLMRRYDMPVYGPAAEAIPEMSRPLHENDVVKLGDENMTFRVLEVPGHTAGHIAYYGEGALFCGDTLFAGGCGRLFEGTAAQMHRSLDKLAALPGETMIYCAHEYTVKNLKFALQVEPDNADLHKRLDDMENRRKQGLPTVPASLDVEKRTNPFLRCQEPSVIAAAEQFAGKSLTGGEETFAVVRRWKDTVS